MEIGNWIPLTEYATRRGISISTLRRKIKTNNIRHKMEEGRYLVLDATERPMPAVQVSSDASSGLERKLDYTAAASETNLHMKALDARVAGLARKVDLFSEQLSELKMLVQIFEERLEKQGE